MDEIRESAPAQRLPGFRFLFYLTQIIGGTLVILVIYWLFAYRDGVAWNPLPVRFNLHPLYMTVGLVFFYGNAMLIYRSQRVMRKRRLKILHAGIMIFCLLLTIIALVAVFDTHNYAQKPIPNMYTLHSWVGLTTVILFACQWVAGLVSFLYPGIQANLRSAYLPIHTFFGIAGFIGAITASLIGLNEKAFFVLDKDYQKFVAEGVMINIIGVFFIIFGGLVVYLVTREEYRRIPQPEDEVLLSGTS